MYKKLQKIVKALAEIVGEKVKIVGAKKDALYESAKVLAKQVTDKDGGLDAIPEDVWDMMVELKLAKNEETTETPDDTETETDTEETTEDETVDDGAPHGEKIVDGESDPEPEGLSAVDTVALAEKVNAVMLFPAEESIQTEGEEPENILKEITDVLGEIEEGDFMKRKGQAYFDKKDMAKLAAIGCKAAIKAQKVTAPVKGKKVTETTETTKAPKKTTGPSQTDIIRKGIKSKHTREKIVETLVSTFDGKPAWANARMKMYEGAYGVMGKDDKKIG